ncbi:MAG: PmbA protein [Hyphomicrobiaceae bacterium]|jgi:PmbA protein
MNESKLIELGHLLTKAALDAGADQAEAAASWSRSVETHIQNGDVHSVQTDDETTFGLRVLVGDRLGFVTANDTLHSLLRERAEEAVAQARVNPSDPWQGLPEPLATTPVDGLFDNAVDELTAKYTTERARELVDHVRGRDERIRIDSGAVSASVSRSALVSTAGVEVSESGTDVSSSLFGMAVDGEDVASFDYESETSRSLAGFEAGYIQAADRFADKCLAGLGAGAGSSFRGAVLLSPDAVAELLLPTFLGAISAEAVRKERSRLASDCGKAVAASCVTLTENGSLAGGVASSAFDREGMPIVPHTLIDAGVLGMFLFNSYEARAAGGDARSTGHASGGVASLPGIGSSYLELDAGDTASADLVSPSETIIHVGRFSGSTNGVTGDFSGVVKGSHIIEAGAWRPVREVLIAGNVFDMLNQVSAISTERHLVGATALLPTLRIEGISITAG